jgi:hypothetical protein
MRGRGTEQASYCLLFGDGLSGVSLVLVFISSFRMRAACSAMARSSSLVACQKVTWTWRSPPTLGWMNVDPRFFTEDTTNFPDKLRFAQARSFALGCGWGISLARCLASELRAGLEMAEMHSLPRLPALVCLFQTKGERVSASLLADTSRKGANFVAKKPKKPKKPECRCI